MINVSALDVIVFLLITALPLYIVLIPAAIWVGLSPRFSIWTRCAAGASLVVQLPGFWVSASMWESHPLIALFADYRLRSLQETEIVDGISMPPFTTISYRWGRPFLVTFIRPGMVGGLPVVRGAANFSNGTLDWHFYHEPVFQLAAEPLLTASGCKFRREQLPDGPALVMAKEQTVECTKALGRP